MRKKAVERQSDILDVLRACEKPMTAYKILEKLQVDEPDIAPPHSVSHATGVNRARESASA